MRHALLLLLLSLTGQPEPAPAPAAMPVAVAVSATAPAAAATPVVVEHLFGAWLGGRTSDGRPGSDPLEAIFSRGIRPGTVVAHFTFVEDGVTRTARRQGRFNDAGLAFELPHGGRIALRPDGDTRLVGEVVEGIGTAPRRGLLTLTRLRR